MMIISSSASDWKWRTYPQRTEIRCQDIILINLDIYIVSDSFCYSMQMFPDLPMSKQVHH